jgi:hypothetical protein
MEALVTIVAVGAYAERQYQKQDGSSERHENAFYITDLQTL